MNKFKTEERIKIGIYISRITKTDMKFQNDKNIHSVRFDTDVQEISSELIESSNDRLQHKIKRGRGSIYGVHH